MRLFSFSLTSVALPALLTAMFFTESVTNTLVFTNINGCILLAEVLFFRWLLSGKVNRPVVGRRRHRALAGGQTRAGATAAAPAAQPAVARRWSRAFAVPLVFNARGVAAGQPTR